MLLELIWLGFTEIKDAVWVDSRKNNSILRTFQKKVARNQSFTSMVEDNLGATTSATSPYVNAKSYLNEAGMKDLLTRLIALQFGDVADSLTEEFL